MRASREGTAHEVTGEVSREARRAQDRLAHRRLPVPLLQRLARRLEAELLGGEMARTRARGSPLAGGHPRLHRRLLAGVRAQLVRSEGVARMTSIGGGARAKGRDRSGYTPLLGRSATSPGIAAIPPLAGRPIPQGVEAMRRW